MAHSKIHPARRTGQTEGPPNADIVTPLTPAILAALNAKAAEIYASGATLTDSGNGLTLTLSDELILDVLESAREVLRAELDDLFASIPQDEIDDTVEAVLRKSFGTGRSTT